jgi:hypothetical protein
MEVGTSSQPLEKKGKHEAPMSLCKQDTTVIVLLCILEGVHIIENMLGHVEKLWYSYHDVTDTEKFPEFTKQVYLQTVGIGPFGEPINQPVQWATRLAKNGILGLLDIPHFGRGQDANNCVKKMLVVTHGGYLWLEQTVSVDVEITAYITGLPTWGETPAQFFDDNTKEKALTDEMKNNYGTERGSRRIIIKRISDTTTRMATKVMVCKLLRKCCKE